MTTFNFDETITKLDSPLLAQAEKMSKAGDSHELDKPITDYVSVPERKGKFSDNPTIKGVESWVKEINPNYDPFDLDSPYNVNYGVCTYVVYERLNGNDAVVASYNNVPTNPEMEKLIGKKIKSMSPEQIEKRLLKAGDGAHAIIGVDREQGAGHWFNAACIEGKVVAIDGQSGEVLD